MRDEPLTPWLRWANDWREAIDIELLTEAAAEIIGLSDPEAADRRAVELAVQRLMDSNVRVPFTHEGANVILKVAVDAFTLFSYEQKDVNYNHVAVHKDGSISLGYSVELRMEGETDAELRELRRASLAVEEISARQWKSSTADEIVATASENLKSLAEEAPDVWGRQCTYCDHGNGPTGIGVLGGRCPRCGGTP